MFVPCEWYYEYILGDNCNNQCEKCFGNKDIRICTKDFELRKNNSLDKFIVKKGSWWVCKFENEEHILLWDGGNIELTLSTAHPHHKDFENFNYQEELRGGENESSN